MCVGKPIWRVLFGWLDVPNLNQGTWVNRSFQLLIDEVVCTLRMRETLAQKESVRT